MSCYLPLVQRWRRQSSGDRKTKTLPAREERKLPLSSRVEARRDTRGVEARQDTRGVEARRDTKGITLSQRVGDVTLHIRHDHPQLDLGDVAYQRLHQDHTSKKEKSSLTLPLGISSLRLASRSRGCESDTEGRRRRPVVSSFYQALAGSTATISQQDLVKEYREEGGRVRRSKLSSAPPPQPRPASVDADLLLGSCSYDNRRMKYAALTSPDCYMKHEKEKDEKSSSGNSSGSDITSEGSPHPLEEEAVHPALRGRTPAPVGHDRPPPPRHLLPARLRPSPLVKLHPVIALSQTLRQGSGGTRKS